MKFHQTGGYKEAMIKVVLPIFFGEVGKIWGRSMPTFKAVFWNYFVRKPCLETKSCWLWWHLFFFSISKIHQVLRCHCWSQKDQPMHRQAFPLVGPSPLCQAGGHKTTKTRSNIMDQGATKTKKYVKKSCSKYPSSHTWKWKMGLANKFRNFGIPFIWVRNFHFHGLWEKGY